MEDAAGSAAVYLCQSGGDLAEPASLRRAVLTYNHSRAYLRLVLAWMEAYDEAGLTSGTGLAALPAVLVGRGPNLLVTARTGVRSSSAGKDAKATAKAPGAATVSAGPGTVSWDATRCRRAAPGRRAPRRA